MIHPKIFGVIMKTSGDLHRSEVLIVTSTHCTNRQLMYGLWKEQDRNGGDTLESSIQGDTEPWFTCFISLIRGFSIYVNYSITCLRNGFHGSRMNPDTRTG